MSSFMQSTLECIERLNKENAELREELEQWHRLTANIELPEYPICTFQPKELERENAELRELLADAREELADMYDYMDGGYAWPSIAEDPSYGPFYKRLCSVLGIEAES